jgi:hypothetical protein
MTELDFPFTVLMNCNVVRDDLYFFGIILANKISQDVPDNGRYTATTALVLSLHTAARLLT